MSMPHSEIVFPPRASSAGTSSRSPSSSVEDDPPVGGHHPARVGDTFKSGRYRVLARLGSGHFSTVWLCFDSQRRVQSAASGDVPGAAVAVKIQKSAERYTEAALDEIQLLRNVKAADPTGTGAVVSLLDSFAHSGPCGRHMCLVFDVLGVSLLSLIKRFRYRGVPLPLVRSVACDMLRGLQFLHEAAGIIHTDLKPENILMVPPDEEYAVIHQQAALYARHLCDVKTRRPQTSACREGERSSHSAAKDANDGMTDDKKLTKNQRKRAKAKARKAKQKEEPLDVSSEDEVDILRREEDLRSEALGENVVGSSESRLASAGACNVGTPSSSDVRLEDSRATLRQVVGSNGTRLPSTEDVGCTTEEPAIEVDVVGDVLEVGTAAGSSAAPSTAAECDVQTFSGIDGVDSDEKWQGGRFVVGNFMDTDNLFRRGKVRIIDLGNACRASTASTGVIQTRQYRSPEVITGGRFGPSADMWSVACLLFELATGEFLFDPHGGRDFDRDEDHLAQMIELLGPIPRIVSSRGAYAHELFNRHGELRHIRDLSFWSLDRVLLEKYDFPKAEAEEFSDFLRLMLKFDPPARSSAAQCLQHRFICGDAL